MKRVVFLVGLIVAGAIVEAQGSPPSWVTEGPYLEQDAASFEIPLKVAATKLYVEVEMGGKPRRFVVDTGSPSMIDAAIVEELGLEVVGRNSGTDSHGTVIESKIVQADVTLGGVEFHKVPMFVADFSASEATRLFIGDGLIGSELLPLGAWQIDLQKPVLRFHTDVQELPFVRDAEKVKLYQFGYPFSPILDVRFAKRAQSKAMFDTGSPTFFAISAADLAGAEKAGGIGKRMSGFGSAGASLGGQAKAADQLQVELEKLSIDGIKLGRVSAAQRDLSPSLIGARMLEHFVVTFDSRSETAYFAEYFEGPFAQPTFGFTLAFEEKISVAMVWDNSPAWKAGLRPGLRITSINGVATESTGEGIRRALVAMGGDQISLTWEGGSATLEEKTDVLDR